MISHKTIRNLITRVETGVKEGKAVKNDILVLSAYLTNAELNSLNEAAKGYVDNPEAFDEVCEAIIENYPRQYDRRTGREI
jgi:hypothetical protein